MKNAVVSYEDDRRRKIYKEIAKAAVAIWGRDNAKGKLRTYVNHLFLQDIDVEMLPIDELAWLRRCLQEQVPSSKKYALDDFF